MLADDATIAAACRALCGLTLQPHLRSAFGRTPKVWAGLTKQLGSLPRQSAAAAGVAQVLMNAAADVGNARMIAKSPNLLTLLVTLVGCQGPLQSKCALRVLWGGSKL